MNKDLRFRINKPSVVYEQFDDEFVLINLDSGNYYCFESVGAYIWEFVQNGTSETEIIDEVARQYAGSLSTIENAVKLFLKELQNEGLIVPDATKEVQTGKELYKQAAVGTGMEKINFETPVLSKFTNMQEFLLVDPIHEIDYNDWPKNKPE